MNIEFAPMEGVTCAARHSGTERADGRSREAEKRVSRAVDGEDA